MGGKKRCICRRSAGGGRRPFAGMKLLPEGRSLVGRGRTLTKTKASSGCRWHEKGTEIIYFFLLSVCILIICAGPYAGFGAAFLAVLFILRPDGKTVRAESAVHAARSGALFWRAFSTDERRLWACFARNVPSLCHLQTIQRPRARSAVLCSLLQTDRARQPPFAFVLAAQP